jgi:hypothetical protein
VRALRTTASQPAKLHIRRHDMHHWTEQCAGQSFSHLSDPFDLNEHRKPCRLHRKVKFFHVHFYRDVWMWMGGREREGGMATTTLRREVKGTLVPARIKTRFSFSALNGMVVAVIAPQQ